MTTLIIVESPGKISSISKYLGDRYIVKASYGHIRELGSRTKIKGTSKLGIDTKDNFKPTYTIIPDKLKVVANLRSAAASVSNVLCAGDDDREGASINWHIAKVLGLKHPKRLKFNSICKKELESAVRNPLPFDDNLVNAAKARQILDKLVGFKISPVLWFQIRHGLSCGRVQSPATRLIVEKETEIKSHKSNASFKVNGTFNESESSNDIKAELSCHLENKDQVEYFLNFNKRAFYKLFYVDTKDSKKNPSPPFITSTLQQEASGKLCMSPGMTMKSAQRLYESGKITYMRTDSTNINTDILDDIVKYIESNYGKEFCCHRTKAGHNPKGKGKNKVIAQEAHEAIRPTNINEISLTNTKIISSDEIRLYELIWRRTIASQMKPAIFRICKVKITVSNKKNKETLDEHFNSSAKKIKMFI